MKTRQWMLAGALGLTLAATWWAAQVEEGGLAEGGRAKGWPAEGSPAEGGTKRPVAEVREPVARAQRGPEEGLRPRTLAADAALSGELALFREPWPAAGSALLQPPLAAQSLLRAAPTVMTPTAPPLPFTFIGSLERGGRRTVMLMEGDALHLVGARERIGERYRVERVTPTQIEFTYLPLQLRQTLDTGQD